MKKYLVLALLLAACTKQPVSEPQPAPNPVPAPAPAPSITIDEIVNSSSCTKYSWKDRGKAPIGYIKGLAYSYAKSYCRVKANDAIGSVMGKELGSASVDAAAHYSLQAGTGLERLRKVYTLLTGLGMRESSGNYGEGRDASATNTAADTAETGLFQFSYNLNSASPALQKVYDYYKAHGDECMESVFKEGVKKAFNNNYSGSGAGLEFQKFARHCPAMATEYTAVGVRVRRTHWGPINRKAAEYKSECEDMYKQVEAAVSCK